MEAQTPLPLSLATRDHARAALARAFEEAATMPGTLLPHELLEELKEAAGRIMAEVLGQDTHALGDGGGGPALYIVEHSIDATVLGLSIGRRLLPEERLTELGIGLFLQDIGKLALPQSLVLKPGPLEPGEWDLMMRHPLLGLEFLRAGSISADAKSVVRSHHERWNGSGYPDGLAGDEIPLLARIAAVADVFCAVTSERFHASALSREHAIELIRVSSGLTFDPAVVDAFLAFASR